MSLDSTMLMEIYPYGGLWAYLKYHYLDGIMKQNLLLIDKTRSDFGTGEKRLPSAQSPKSKADVDKINARFNIGTEKERQINKVRKEIGG